MIRLGIGDNLEPELEVKVPVSLDIKTLPILKITVIIRYYLIRYGKQTIQLPVLYPSAAITSFIVRLLDVAHSPQMSSEPPMDSSDGPILTSVQVHTPTTKNSKVLTSHERRRQPNGTVERRKVLANALETMVTRMLLGLHISRPRAPKHCNDICWLQVNSGKTVSEITNVGRWVAKVRNCQRLCVSIRYDLLCDFNSVKPVHGAAISPGQSCPWKWIAMESKNCGKSFNTRNPLNK